MTNCTLKRACFRSSSVMADRTRCLWHAAKTRCFCRYMCWCWA